MKVQMSDLFYEAIAIRCRFSIAKICDPNFVADSLQLDVGTRFDAYLLGQAYWDHEVPKVFEGTSLAALFAEGAELYRNAMQRMDNLPPLELVA